MKADGAAQELKGDAQKATGDTKNAAEDAVDKTAEALKSLLELVPSRGWRSNRRLLALPNESHKSETCPLR